MMKSLRQNKGITLIALVITIIVLLLLAGVAISMLTGENGIITKTNSAKTETGMAEEKESVQLAVLTALTKGNGSIEPGSEAIATLQNELEKAGCKNFADINSLPAIAEMQYKSYEIDQYGNIGKVPTIEEIIESGEPVKKKTTLIDANKDTVVIPERFKIASNSTKLVKEGIVVIPPDDSEFVWVPVKDINKMLICKGSSGSNDCKIEKSGNELVCSTHIGQDICGRLYGNDSDTGFYDYKKSQQYNQDSGIREPAILKSTSDGDASSDGLNLLSTLVGVDNLTDWEKQLQDEFEAMAISVYENHGFYVGRYETSIRTAVDGTTKIAQSITNQTPANATVDLANTWYGLYQIEKEYSLKNNLTDVVNSTMIWGSQYDQIMLWIIENGYDVTSTFSSKNTNGTTTGGATNEDKLNNIYDLMGCNTEWTLEASGKTQRSGRGGAFNSDMAPADRYKWWPVAPINSFSSRVSLYIQ